MAKAMRVLLGRYESSYLTSSSTSYYIYYNNNNKSSSSSFCFSSGSLHRLLLHNLGSKIRFLSTNMATSTPTGDVVVVDELLPPVQDSSSDPPSLFDGTTRLYISYMCPYAQRAWIARNCKGLQDKIRLVAIDLGNKPIWYKEKLYPANKVPALEHNNEVIGESLDLIKYIDSHFEGPTLFPEDPAKVQFAEELFSYTDTFNKDVTAAIKGNGEIDVPLDYLEKALAKFEDGPFFLGQFSLVDIAFVPFTQRYHPLLLEVKQYDITTGRPKLTSWVEEMDKNEAYKITKMDPQMLLAVLKKVYALN